MVYADFASPNTEGAPLDQMLVCFFPGPTSFTGEDMLELQCHGSPFIVGRVMAILHDLGIQPAGPGQFSERAWLNGKMSLTEAEGIASTLAAETEDQWRAAQSLVSGALALEVRRLREQLLRVMAWVAARIDFPEEQDVVEGTTNPCQAELETLRGWLDQLVASYGSGRVHATGLCVGIVGPPNAGKSTLFNSLLGTHRALVSRVPGTTRDYLEEGCIIQGRMFRLIDTAGLRETSDPLELMGIAQLAQLKDRMDLLLVVADVRRPPQEILADLGSDFSYLASLPQLHVRTHADLEYPGAPRTGTGNSLLISALTGTGLNALRDALCSEYDRITARSDARSRASTLITLPRHRDALLEARQGVTRALHTLESQEGDEVLALSLQEVAASLNRLLGDIDPEEILGEVFSRFCVGK